MKRWIWSVVLAACCAPVYAQSPLPKTAFGDEGIVWVAEEELFVDAAQKIAPTDPARRHKLDWFYEGASAYQQGLVQCAKAPPPIDIPIAWESGDPFVQFADRAQVALIGDVVATASGLFGGRPIVLLEVRARGWLLHPDDQPRPDIIRMTYPAQVSKLAGIPVCSGDGGWPSPPPSRGARVLVASDGTGNDPFGDGVPFLPIGAAGIVFESAGRAYMNEKLAASDTVRNGMPFARFLRLVERELAR